MSYSSPNEFWISSDRTTKLSYAAGVLSIYVDNVQVISLTSSAITALVEQVQQGGGSVATNTAYGDDALAANTTRAKNSAFGEDSPPTRPASTTPQSALILPSSFTKVLRDSGYADWASAHGFRSSFKTWCAEAKRARRRQ